MKTIRWCENCSIYSIFCKVGKNDSPRIPWICNNCGAEIMKFKKYKWPHGGVKSRDELEEIK